MRVQDTSGKNSLIRGKINVSTKKEGNDMKKILQFGNVDGTSICFIK